MISFPSMGRQKDSCSDIQYIHGVINPQIYYTKKMGIKGLHKLVKPVTASKNISQFSGQILGIDALPMLYRGCYCDAKKQEMSQDQVSISCLNFLRKMLDLLKTNNIKPIFVFDGKNMKFKKPAKGHRRYYRQNNKNKMAQMIKSEKKFQTKKYLKKVVLTEEIVGQAMNQLKNRDIDFMVAPYESDSQLAEYRRLGIIDAVVSEDSDLLVYGINTIFKLKLNGKCDYVDLNNCKVQQIENKPLRKFMEMEHDERMLVCLLAGCDYISNIKGIGIQKAIKFMDGDKDIFGVVENIRKSKTYRDKIPQSYEIKLFESSLIFKHATVFNPFENNLEYLNPLSQEMEIDHIVGVPRPQYLESNCFSQKDQARTLEKTKTLELNQQQINKAIGQCLKSKDLLQFLKYQI